MDLDENDDIYEPEEPKVENGDEQKAPPSIVQAEELEEGEEEDESGAMDEDDDEDDDSVCHGSVCNGHEGTLADRASFPAGHRHHHRAKRRHESSSSTVRLAGPPGTPSTVPKTDASFYSLLFAPCRRQTSSHFTIDKPNTAISETFPNDQHPTTHPASRLPSRRRRTRERLQRL